MDNRKFSVPVDLKSIKVTDEFWHREQELVRTQVIPYQWDALNDRVEGAAPSFCMRNFKVAGQRIREGKMPGYTFKGFEALPDDPKHPDKDEFYGFVFQDTDFSKWIEAVAYSLTQTPDEQLEKTADEAIDIVCAAQLPNGYLDTYYIINGMDRAFTNLKDHHELYCLGHLTEGAVAYYEATGKDKLLKAAARFADYVYERFGNEEGKCKGYPGHEIAEMALVRLYNATGEKKYLELSKYFLTQRGTSPYYFDIEEAERAAYENRTYKSNNDPMRYAYYQAHKPVYEQDEAVGHSVRAVYLYSGMADVARLTGDEKMFEACEKLWNSITNEKLYVTGGIGATHIGEAFSHPYDLPNDTAYSETCAAIGLAFFARRMLEIKADSKYADVMELALYNTVLSGMSLDGKSFFYVNPLEVVPDNCHKDARKHHVKSVRQKWFGCACCPPNIARIVSSVAAYAYTENETTLWTHLYMGSAITRNVDGSCMILTTQTDMPWDGNVKVNVKTDRSVKYTLAYRIPGWCNPDEYTVKCSSDKKTTVKDGYIYIEGQWNGEEEVELYFPMRVRMLCANDNVREDAGKVAFMRGPVTYCLEEIDNGKNLHMYGVDINSIDEELSQVDTVVTNELGHKMVKLVVPGVRKNDNKETKLLYSDFCFDNLRMEKVSLTLIPYYAWNNRGEGEMSVWIRLR